MVSLHLLFEPTHFGLYVVDLFKRRQSRCMDSFAGFEIDVLAQQTQPKSVDLDHVPIIGCLFTRNDPEYGGFTCSIAADEPNFLRRVDLERDPFEDLGSTVRFPYI